METQDQNTQTFSDTPAPAQTPVVAYADVAIEVAKTVTSVVAATNPKAAVVVEVAEASIELLQQAIALQKSGTIQPGTVAALFENLGRDVLAKHVQWTAQP